MLSKSKRQQWELLASPGHVFLARVDQYRRKTRVPTVVAGLSVLLWVSAFWISPAIATKVGGAVGWVVGTGGGLVGGKPVPQSPAPQLKALLPIIPPNFQFNGAQVPKLVEDVLPEVIGQVAAMDVGKRMEACDFTKKISETWFDGVDMTPRCRYSKDFDRLWVWALVNNKGQYQAWMGLVSKIDGKARLLNVKVRGGAQIDGQDSIDPLQIPRAVAADFPELLKTGG